MHKNTLSKAAIFELQDISREIWYIVSKEDGNYDDFNLATDLLKQISFQIDHICDYIYNTNYANNERA